jgi:hypothetical protein
MASVAYGPVLTATVDQVYAIRSIGYHKEGLGLFSGEGPYVIT